VRGEAYLGYRRKDKKSTLDILYMIHPEMREKLVHLVYPQFAKNGKHDIV